MFIKTYDEIFESLKANFLANQNKVTDFNNASIIKAFCEAVATEEARKYLETDIGYMLNLNSVPASVFEFKKKDGIRATGTVVFSRSSQKGFVTVIPSGTVVSGGAYKFITTAAITIKEGEKDSAPITILAEKEGADYNLSIGAINSIESSVSSDVIKVANDTKTAGGVDEETDSEMLTRFKLYINGLQGTSSYGLKNAVMSVTGVRSVNTIEHFSDDTTPYNVTVYAEDGTGNLAESIKKDIETVINGDNTAVNPGKRAPGINVEVKAPGIVSVDIKLTCYYYRVDTDVAKKAVEDNIRDYINSLIIGNDVILTSLIAEIRKLSYIKDVKIESLRSKDDSIESDGLKNLVISGSQIARFGNCDLTLEAYNLN